MIAIFNVFSQQQQQKNYILIITPYTTCTPLNTDPSIVSVLKYVVLMLQTNLCLVKTLQK